MTTPSSSEKTKRSELRIASISDIHLGHSNTPTKHIIRNLDKAFANTPETAELDIVFIVGDLFDTGIAYYDPQVAAIEAWAIRFFKRMARMNVIVRILEGTRSHDRRQSFNLVNLYEELRSEKPGECPELDLKFVEAIEVEYIAKLGISVLYVPDDLHPDTDVIWQQVQQVMATEGVEKVDYTLLHGSFSYQLPDFVTAPKHDPDRYQRITNKYVFAGHIHKSSKHGKILANGSFDRLTHGEEEPKGHWRVTARENGRDDIVFVENKDAQIYRSLECQGLSIEEALEKCSIANKLPAGSFVRLLVKADDAILTNIDVVRNTYPLIRWTTKEVDKKAVQPKLLVDLRETFHEVEITPVNVSVLVEEKLSRLNVSDEQTRKCLAALTEIIGG